MEQTAKDFFRSLKSAEKDAIADRCGIKRTYLNNLIYSSNKASVPLAAKLEQATGYKVSRVTIRPDVNWKLIAGTL